MKHKHFVHADASVSTIFPYSTCKIVGNYLEKAENAYIWELCSLRISIIFYSDTIVNQSRGSNEDEKCICVVLFILISVYLFMCNCSLEYSRMKLRNFRLSVFDVDSKQEKYFNVKVAKQSNT